MQSIQQGIENKIIINSKGLYSYVLIQFYSNITCQSFYAVFQDLTLTLTFTTVNINEVGPDGVVDWLAGEVQLNPTGGWTLTIYTQANATNTDPYNAEYLTEIEAIVLPVEDCEQNYSPSNSCADGVLIIKDQNGDIVETVQVPSGQTSETEVNTGQTLQELWEASTTEEKIVLYDGLTNEERLELFNGISNAKKEQLVFYTYPYPSLYTGQVTSYQTGDDKHQWDNTYTPEINSWPTDRVWVFPVLDSTDFNLLKRGATASGFNIFGNLQRFTDDLGTQFYASGVLIDHYLGIMVDITFKAASNWSNAISGSVVSTFYGKNDWRIKNYNQWVLFTRRAQNGTYLSGLPPITFLNVPANSGNVFTWTSTSADGSLLLNANNYVLRQTDNNAARNVMGTQQKANPDIRSLYSRKCFTYNALTGLIELS